MCLNANYWPFTETFFVIAAGDGSGDTTAGDDVGNDQGGNDSILMTSCIILL